jgi:DNA-binding CsgD family transcriptional regulator
MSVEQVAWASVLSPRETEVTFLVGRGLSNKEVARKLALAEPTVKQHMNHILRKLGVPSGYMLILSMNGQQRE